MDRWMASARERTCDVSLANGRARLQIVCVCVRARICRRHSLPHATEHIQLSCWQAHLQLSNQERAMLFFRLMVADTDVMVEHDAAATLAAMATAAACVNVAHVTLTPVQDLLLSFTVIHAYIA